VVIESRKSKKGQPNEKKTKGETMIFKTLLEKQKIEEHLKTGMN